MAVEVTISGVLYDKLSRTTRPCVLIGEATMTGLEIGGGPIIPERPPLPGRPVDPGWGVGVGHPSHPIVRPGRPVDPGYGIEEGGPIPPKPTEPPPDGSDKPPPDSGGWGFVSEWSQWGYFPASDEPQPK